MTQCVCVWCVCVYVCVCVCVCVCGVCVCAGTDATHAEHIETIKSRNYAGVQADGSFVPGELGMGLVEGTSETGIVHLQSCIIIIIHAGCF